MRRTEQRRAAIWALYQSDLLGRPLEQSFPRDAAAFTRALAGLVRDRQGELDELIRTVGGAHNALLDLEQLTEADLDHLRARYEWLGRAAREDLLRGLLDTNTPDVPAEAVPATNG